MEVGEGQELEDNIDKMADKDMIKNNDVTVMFMMVEEDTKKDNYGELEMALEVVNHW